MMEVQLHSGPIWATSSTFRSHSFLVLNIRKGGQQKQCGLKLQQQQPEAAGESNMPAWRWPARTDLCHMGP